MKLTYLQKKELAETYLKERGISFGNPMSDEKAIEIYIAGLEYRESQYNHTIQEFKDAYIGLFKFHCQEIVKK